MLEDIQMNKLSIIIPCKDRVNHLLQCLGTIRAQSVQPYEVIIVDYDCPDNTKGIVRAISAELNWNALRVIQANTLNESFNLSRARNQGYAATTGDILFFCDADTILQPTFIERHLEDYRNGSFFCGWGAADSTGNMIISRDMFVAANGYNEALTDWGFEDIAIYKRLEGLGWERRPFEWGTKSIQHSDFERVKHYTIKDKWTSNEKNALHQKWVGLRQEQ